MNSPLDTFESSGISGESDVLMVSNLTRGYGKGRGIFNTSFSLQPKRILSFIGANASGKSTLMRCATLFDLMDQGTIVINGEIIVDVGEDICTLPSKNDLIKLHGGIVGAVFQDSQPWPHLTVEDNVVLPLVKSLGFSNVEARQHAATVLHEFGLEDRLSSFPWELSGGLRQRVVLARALALNPQFIAIDEGTSALDPDWTERVRLILRKYAEAGAAVLLISHQMGFVKRLSDDVCFLHHGRIHEQGDPSRIFENPQTQELKEFLENA